MDSADEFVALAPTVAFGVVDGGVLVATERRALRLSPPSLVWALDRLRVGCGRDELYGYLGQALAERLLDQLTAHDLLVDTASNDSIGTAQSKQFGYLARFSDSPNAAQERLRDAAVAILGVGGVGAVVLDHLLGAGVTTLHLIDDDRIALDNLNRQFIYDARSVGTSKVVAAAKHVAHLHPDASVQIHELRVRTSADLHVLDDARVDLLVVAADQPRDLMSAAVNDYCWARSLPFVSAGVGIEVGFWGPLLIPNETACFSCFEQALLASASAAERELQANFDGAPPAYSFGPTNTLISAFLARDVLHFLGGLRECSCIGKRVWLTFTSEGLPSFGATPCSHTDNGTVAR